MEAFVGIDVSKEVLDIKYNQGGKVLQVSNTPRGIGKLITQLKKNKPKLVVMEATGGLERQAFRLLHEAGLNVHVANPRVTHNFAKGTGKLAKTDKIDAEMLAFYAERMLPGSMAPVSKKIEMLRDVVIRRKQIVNMKTQEKNRLSGSHLDDFIRDQIKKTIEFHEEQIKQLDEYLEKAILEDTEMKARYDLLMKVKGIGPVSAMTLITAMPELGTMNKKQAAALLGVAPFNNDSGKSKGYRKCMGGRANVRSALFSATMAAIRFNPDINQFAKRLIPTKGNNGKISKIIVVACMRKLIGMLNAILRDKTDWDAEYYKKFI